MFPQEPLLEGVLSITHVSPPTVQVVNEKRNVLVPLPSTFKVYLNSNFRKHRMMENLLKRWSCLLGKHAESRILLLLVSTLAMVEPGKPPISLCPVMALILSVEVMKKAWRKEARAACWGGQRGNCNTAALKRTKKKTPHAWRNYSVCEP